MSARTGIPAAGHTPQRRHAHRPSGRGRRRSRLEVFRLARRRRRAARLARRTLVGRHPVRALLLLAVVALAPLWVSLGDALGNPGFGSSMPARFAEWAREHGASGVVDWAENLWYTHHQPPAGGTPPKGSIPLPVALLARAPSAASTTAGSSVHASPPARSTGASASRVIAPGDGSPRGAGRSVARASRPAHGLQPLPLPTPIVPLASPALPGEGDWHPAGRLVDGRPAVYEAFLRPDAVHTSLVAGVAWMDTRLLRATLYSGSMIPGGGPYSYTAPVSPAAARSLDAAFNAGFLMNDAQGGYYTDGRTEIPLRVGAASFVAYRNGDATVGAWGSDVTMTPQVVSVRQNLDLLVVNGKAVPGLNPNDTTQWGFTLGNAVYVWRSGLGVTADGALVYVAGPGLNITTLADLLVRAGAVRAMELDINTDWVTFSTYTPSTPTGAASPANGSELLSDMVGTPARWFEPWWARDFITMSARPAG